jgi:hypothetical protein
MMNLRYLEKKISEFFLRFFLTICILKFSYILKNVGISISKCLKSAEKNRRANQTARAILSAPTVCDPNMVTLRRLEYFS